MRAKTSQAPLESRGENPFMRQNTKKDINVHALYTKEKSSDTRTERMMTTDDDEEEEEDSKEG
ncbi:unnamed protein product [Larinioides sclopetarius]|uniref:Uncharacterized protein n=1 Tax=Larinioides sclopetarius TaxID=280406 RepID=A0AAV2ABC8_9ARAC